MTLQEFKEFAGIKELVERKSQKSRKFSWTPKGVVMFDKKFKESNPSKFVYQSGEWEDGKPIWELTNTKRKTH